MSKFKVGDKVKVVKNNPENSLDKNYIGYQFIITRICKSNFPKIGYWIYGDNDLVNCEDEIELIEETKPKFKLNQKFKVIKRKDENTSGSYPYDKAIGMIGYKCGTYLMENSDNTGSYYGIFDDDELELIESCNSCEVTNEMKFYKYNEPTNSSENKVGKIMSNITKFVKESLLSADEKLLRKVGLKDSCGDYSSTAQELVLGKLVRENEAYLIETAKAMEAEEKANK